MNREAVVRELVKIAKSLVSVERLSFLSWYDNEVHLNLVQASRQKRVGFLKRRH